MLERVHDSDQQPQDQPHRSSARSLTRKLGAAALLLVLGAGALAPAASGDEIADKKAQAAALAAKIHDLNEEVEKYAELSHGARYELDQINTRIGEAQTKIGSAQAEQDLRRTELAAFAVDAYVRGGDADPETFAPAGQGVPADAAAAYLAAAANNRQSAIDRMSAAEEDYRTSLGELESAKVEAEAKQAEIDQQRNAAQAAADAQDRLYDQVQGELATLVQAAQAAESERQRAAAAASRPAMARNSSSRSASLGPAPATRGGVDAVIAEAKRQLGKPYVWGGSGPDSFDCSGFTAWVWREAGVNLAHYTGAQYSATRHISLSELQPGDLVFYGSDLGHVALYVGNDTIIHAPNRRSVVRYDSLYYWNTSMVASRP